MVDHSLPRRARPPLPIGVFQTWLALGEHGVSSLAIVRALTGVAVGAQRALSPTGHDYPRDPADFRRCELLLRAVPQARDHLHLLGDGSPQWAALVAEWGQIRELIEKEAPGYLTARGDAADDLMGSMWRRSRETRGAAPASAALMSTLIQDAGNEKS